MDNFFKQNAKFTTDLTLNGIKMVGYGASGVGKTTLGLTMPNPLYLSAEAGLLPILRTKMRVPYIEIKDFDTMLKAVEWAEKSEEAKPYSLIIDSLTEVAEIALAEELKKTKDGRQAYGNMQIAMSELFKRIQCNLHQHVYMICHVERSEDDLERTCYAPSMPGKNLTKNIPYYFDEVFALIAFKDNGALQRALKCQPDIQWTAKDRSFCLNEWEQPNLGAIIEKIASNIRN